MALLIGNILGDAARSRPEAVGLSLGERGLTFGQLDDRCDRTARALGKLGIGLGAVVAWWSDASVRQVDGFFACGRLGAACAPINPQLPEAEVGPILDYLKPSLVISDVGHLEATVRVVGDRPLIIAVAGISDEPGVDAQALAAASKLVASDRAINLDEITDLADSGPLGREDGAPDQLDDSTAHAIYLTSGTTGVPKGVVVSHRASWLRASAAGGAFGVPWGSRQGLVTCFPLFHYSGWHYIMEAWQNRVADHLVRRASAQEIIGVTEQWRPTAIYCIPAVWERVLDPAHEEADLSSLRRADTGTSAVSADLVARIRRRLPGAYVSILYGSTEGGHTTTLADGDVERKPGSVGYAAPPSVVKVDEDGEVLVWGETLMNGYLDRPAETAEALVDGWYHTGDLGHFDDDGFLYITGRRRDIIRTGGESVAPTHVESVLKGHPALAEVAVIGIPDERFGETISAVIVVHQGFEAPGVDELRSYLADRLPAFAHPRQVVVVDDLPHTQATGQVQRRIIREAVLGQREVAPSQGRGMSGQVDGPSQKGGQS